MTLNAVITRTLRSNVRVRKFWQLNRKSSEEDRYRKKVEKEYVHYFYNVNLDTELNNNDFEINGIKFKWFSYNDLLNDERIQKVNDDVVGFIKEFNL